MRDRQIHVVTRIISVSHRDNNNNNNNDDDDNNNNNNDDDDDDNNNNNNNNEMSTDLPMNGYKDTWIS